MYRPSRQSLPRLQNEDVAAERKERYHNASYFIDGEDLSTQVISLALHLRLRQLTPTSYPLQELEDSAILPQGLAAARPE